MCIHLLMLISGPAPYRACGDLQVATTAFPAQSEHTSSYHYLYTVHITNFYLLGVYNHKKECQYGMLVLRGKYEICTATFTRFWSHYIF
jgi:hypothetical protein